MHKSTPIQAVHQRVLLCSLLVAGCSFTNSAEAFEIKASVGLSQFGDPPTVIYNSNNPIFSGPNLSISREGANTKVFASASPMELIGEFSTHSSGINVPFAEARLENAGIIFRNLSSLSNSINPAQGFIDLSLNFDVSYYLETEPNPGLFRQAVSSVFTAFFSRYGTAGVVTGSADSLNYPDKHTFDTYGIFRGLSEQGGSGFAKLPIRIYSQYLTDPSYLNDRSEFIVPFLAHARVSGLALAEIGAKGQVRVGIPDLAYFVTMADGTSVESLGWDIGLIPDLPDVPDDPATAVPTPAMLPAVIGFGLQLWRKRREESRSPVPR